MIESTNHLFFRFSNHVRRFMTFNDCDTLLPASSAFSVFLILLLLLATLMSDAAITLKTPSMSCFKPLRIYPLVWYRSTVLMPSEPYGVRQLRSHLVRYSHVEDSEITRLLLLSDAPYIDGPIDASEPCNVRLLRIIPESVFTIACTMPRSTECPTAWACKVNAAPLT